MTKTGSLTVRTVSTRLESNLPWLATDEKSSTVNFLDADCVLVLSRVSEMWRNHVFEQSLFQSWLRLESCVSTRALTFERFFPGKTLRNDIFLPQSWERRGHWTAAWRRWCQNGGKVTVTDALNLRQDRQLFVVRDFSKFPLSREGQELHSV